MLPNVLRSGCCSKYTMRSQGKKNLSNWRCHPAPPAIAKHPPLPRAAKLTPCLYAKPIWERGFAPFSALKSSSQPAVTLGTAGEAPHQELRKTLLPPSTLRAVKNRENKTWMQSARAPTIATALPLCAQRLDDGGEEAAVLGGDLRDVLRAPDVGVLHRLGEGGAAWAVAEGAGEVAAVARRHRSSRSFCPGDLQRQQRHERPAPQCPLQAPHPSPSPSQAPPGPIN